MARLCEGRVVIVTGAGRGIGREHALEFARQGARVVVNDLGGAVDGKGSSSSPAREVAEQIERAGGEAISNGEDIADFQGAKRLIEAAVRAFGGLDVLVCNAGILRDRMLTNMEEAEWDDVMRVHLKGTYAPARHAAAYWRERHKAGQPADARIITTSSASGLFANPGQTNYAAAKAGIAAFTLVAAKELERYGVTANCIAPGARTRMTSPLGFGGGEAKGGFDAFSPDNISPLVAWLGSSESRGITGRVFEVMGGRIGVANGWTRGPEAHVDRRWDASEVGGVMHDLLAKAAPPEPVFRPR